MSTIAVKRKGLGLGLVAWLLGIVFFLPIAWMALTSFHSETDAATNPPSFGAALTLDGYREFFGAGGGASPWPALINSTVASLASTLFVLVLALPAAYALSIRPVKKWTDVLFFFLSTKMLPVVAGLLPIYLFAKNTGMLDNIWLLVVLYTSMNLPIAVWMMQSFLADVPVSIIEAAQVDGARLPTVLTRVVAPVAAPGIAVEEFVWLCGAVWVVRPDLKAAYFSGYGRSLSEDEERVLRLLTTRLGVSYLDSGLTKEQPHLVERGHLILTRMTHEYR